MASISALCTRGVILKNGTVEEAGQVEDIIQSYLRINESFAIKQLQNRFTEGTSPIAYYTKVILKNPKGEIVDTVKSGDNTTIELHYKAQKELLNLNFFIGLYNNAGEKLLHLGSIYSSLDETKHFTSNQGVASCNFSKLPLPPGTYTLNLSMYLNNERIDMVHDAFRFQVESGDFYNNGKIPESSINRFLIEQNWKID
jgi:hypothetical protein